LCETMHLKPAQAKRYFHTVVTNTPHDAGSARLCPNRSQTPIQGTPSTSGTHADLSATHPRCGSCATGWCRESDVDPTRLAAMTKLMPTDPAPSFDLPDADGRRWSLADLGPGPVVVYFYPAALTPGCTIEAVDFTALHDQFAAAGIAVAGISPDPPEKLKQFIDTEKLNVVLLSDSSRAVIDAYGAWGTKVLYGKEMQGVIRSTFVVDVTGDGSGTIRLAQYNVKATGHVARLAKELGIG